MSFKDGSFSQRFGALGDEAEAVFEEVYPAAWTRYGLNRPSVPMNKLPAYIRYTPDYLTSRGLVEVQGFGTDQTAKFKQDKLAALSQWHLAFRVDFFLWDSYQKRYGWLRLPDLMAVIRQRHAATFPEGKLYFALKADELPIVDAWVPYGEAFCAER